jgi:two-component system OmpR family response regulator
MSRAKKLRVLVADDHADSVAMLALLIQGWGYEVKTASDGGAALDLAKRWWPDVAVLDIGMPILTGYEVARQVCLLSRTSRGRPQPFLVALTGYGDGEAIQLAEHVGFDIHLLKPVNMLLLQRMLGSLSKEDEGLYS